MDPSGHDLQSVTVKYALEGVRITDLTAEERVAVLRYFLRTYISGWGGNPPGFKPYMATMEKHGWDARLRSSIPNNVRVLELTRLRHLECMRGVWGKVIASEVRLLVSDDGTLLYEAMYYFPGASPRKLTSGPHYRLKLCTDEQILRLLNEPEVLTLIISNLERGLAAKKRAAQDIIDRADNKLRIFSRLA